MTYSNPDFQLATMATATEVQETTTTKNIQAWINLKNLLMWPTICYLNQ